MRERQDSEHQNQRRDYNNDKNRTVWSHCKPSVKYSIKNSQGQGTENHEIPYQWFSMGGGIPQETYT